MARKPVSIKSRRKRVAETKDDMRIEVVFQRFSRTGPQARAWDAWWQKTIGASLIDLSAVDKVEAA